MKYEDQKKETKKKKKRELIFQVNGFWFKIFIQCKSWPEDDLTSFENKSNLHIVKFHIFFISHLQLSNQDKSKEKTNLGFRVDAIHQRELYLNTFYNGYALLLELKMPSPPPLFWKIHRNP